MDPIIEQLPTSGDLKETLTIDKAEPTVDVAEDAVPLGEATPELIAEASKPEAEETVKTIGDKITKEETESKEEVKEIGNKKETETKDIEDEDSSDEFKVPEDGIESKEDNSSQEEESSWTKVGKEIGIELQADDFEEFKTKIQEKETASYEKGKAEAAKIELEKYSPEAQKVIQFLNSDPNATIDDFINPVKELDAVLDLDDEGIIRKDLELRGWDADKIDDRISLLEKTEALDSTAYELRKIVEGNKETIKNTLVENKRIEAQERQNQYLAETKKENEQIKSAIESTEVFMGMKLNKEVKDFLTKKWETGEYRKMMQTNPEVAVKSMLHHYLGEQAAKELKTESFQKARDNIQEKLHNIEQIGNGGNTSGRKAVKVSHDNHFGAWEEAIKSGEGLTTTN